MSSSDEIAEIVSSAGLRLAGSVATNPTADSSYFIPIAMGATVKGRRNPSGKLLAEAKKRLLEAGYATDFLMVSESGQKIEESLRHSLMSSYPLLVRNSFLSGESAAPQVWIETKRKLSKASAEQIEAHVQKFAHLMSLRTINLNLLSEAQTPTKTEVLSAVRQLAPVTLDVLSADLTKREFEVPSLDWLRRSLNAMKKAGLVIVTGSEHYVLTLDALRRLGTAKGRRSRDVTRLLALGRRRG